MTPARPPMPPADPAAKAVVLKPCPFCGGAPEITGLTVTEIRCSNDQCISAGAFNNYGHRQDAIDAWNTRTEITPQHGGDDE